MVNVVSFVTHLTTTSVPVEISASIGERTDATVTIVSFYDDEIPNKGGIQNLEEVNVIPLGANSRFDVTAFLQLWRLLRRESIDVLHTHHNFIGSVARVIGSFAGVGIVDTEHRQHPSLSPLQNAVNFPTLPLADRVITNSLATKESLYWFERSILREEKLDVVYNGIDIGRIADATERLDKHDPNGSLQIITVGRMAEVKNQETLLRAFGEVSHQIPEAKLTFVGDGPRRETLKTLANELGIQNTVEFVGTIAREEVYQKLSESDIFVISSSAEGFCVAAVEAMACGLPVVASDIPIFHEVVGDCGRFADPDDPDSFAQTLSELCTDEQMRTTLGEEAEKRAKSVFPLERTVEQYYKIYKDVAATDEQ